MTKLILLHLFATLMMTGVIWVVQLVTYPQFLKVDPASFPAFHADYSRRITWIVLPLMFLELGTACLLAWLHWGGESGVGWAVGCAMTIALWAITFLVQVPQHGALSREGWSDSVIRALVLGNWSRTVLWSLRSGLVLWLAARALAR